jgi:hypothetical protein
MKGSQRLRAFGRFLGRGGLLAGLLFLGRHVARTFADVGPFGGLFLEGIPAPAGSLYSPMLIKVIG